jgi:ubiquinone/menaquinone biosynthesis C-methylase UbiE
MQDEAIRGDVWKGSDLVATYLKDVRGGVPFGAAQIEIALRMASAFTPAPRVILDLGCGDGIVGAAARQLWPDAELILLDFSAAMLESARSRFAANAKTSLIEADFGDPEWVNRLPNQPDIVLSGYAIHHQEDDRKQALYREIFDVLSPGGCFINIEHVAPATPAISALNDDLFVNTLEAHQRAIGSSLSRDEIAASFYNRPDKAANRLSPVWQQLEWLREIGFVDVDCGFKVFELAVFGGRKA